MSPQQLFPHVPATTPQVLRRAGEDCYRAESHLLIRLFALCAENCLDELVFDAAGGLLSTGCVAVLRHVSSRTQTSPEAYRSCIDSSADCD